VSNRAEQLDKILRVTVLRWTLTLCAALFLVLGACASPEVEQSERESAAIDRSLRMVAASAQQRGDHATALTYYRRLHRNDPNDVAVLLGLARSLRAIGSAKEAAQLLEKALAEGPENSALLSELGRAQLMIGNYAGAIASLNEAITAGNDEWQTLMALGISYDREGSHVLARQAYDAALLLSKDNTAVLNNLALSHALDGAIGTGIRILERAASSPGATMQVRQNLALLYGIDGNEELAAKLAAIDLDPADVKENLETYRALRSDDADLKEALGSKQPVGNDRGELAKTIQRGPLRIEVGGSPTVESAIDLWETLRTRHQNTLAKLNNVEIVEQNLANGNSRFLTWAGPIADTAQASAICADLKSSNIHCAIVNP
tara:strand:+ start:1033 stop:2160 length:1128 start_codon:yes stop_codon:yes gene_type:complete